MKHGGGMIYFVACSLQQQSFGYEIHTKKLCTDATWHKLVIVTTIVSVWIDDLTKRFIIKCLHREADRRILNQEAATCISDCTYVY